MPLMKSRTLITLELQTKNIPNVYVVDMFAKIKRFLSKEIILIIWVVC